MPVNSFLKALFQPYAGLVSSVFSSRGLRTIGLVMGLMMATAPQVMAQCVYNAGTYTCSGNVGTTSVGGTGGSDIFSFLSGVIGQITVISGGGSDTIDFSSYTSGVNINLGNVSAQTVATGLTIFFSGFESGGQSYSVNGGSGNDIIHGSYGNDTINGNGGNDSISGGWLDNPAAYGNDNSGNDTITGGDGNDFIIGGHGNDTLYGDAGDDDLHGYAGDDVVYGGDGNDILHGNNDTDMVYGDAGDDVLTGGLGGGVLDGGPGTDTMSDDALGCLYDTPVNIEVTLCGTPPTPPPPPPPQPVTPAPLPPNTDDLCITESTRVALDGSMLLVFSDFRDTTNGMPITHIPLASLLAPTDEEKASGAPIWVGYKDSEYAPGWSASVYWQNSHYGFVIYKDGGKTIYDDTDAICGWF